MLLARPLERVCFHLFFSFSFSFFARRGLDLRDDQMTLLQDALDLDLEGWANINCESEVYDAERGAC